MIQFVYDYFMAGDFSRADAALAYKEAVLKEVHGDVDRVIRECVPAYVILRPLAAAYELDHDARIRERTQDSGAAWRADLGRTW